MTFDWFAVREKGVPEGDALDARLSAVVPFRIGGADPSLRYLREGMLDLMAATLVSDDGTHAVDPLPVLRRRGLTVHLWHNHAWVRSIETAMACRALAC
jgi:hypothetical protein